MFCTDFCTDSLKCNAKANRRKLKLSRGEICVANFIPHCEWGESREPCPQMAVFGQKQAISPQKCQPILFRQSWDNWGQNSSQTDRQILWHHIRVCVDFFFKLNFLPYYSLRSEGISEENSDLLREWQLTYVGIKMPKF